MVEPLLACYHGLTKQLLAKMGLTNGCSSSKAEKMPSKSHPTAPNGDGQTNGAQFVAMCPQDISGAVFRFSPG